MGNSFGKKDPGNCVARDIGVAFQRLGFLSCIMAIRPVVSKGIIAREARTGRIEKMSDSFPVRAVIIPPAPKANPIIRLEIKDLPRGANSCAIATPRGRVARTKNPARKTPR